MATDNDLGTPSERIAELEDALRERTFELDVLYELSSKLGEDLTYEQLSLVILSHLGQAIRYDVAASLLNVPDECGCNLHLHATRELTPAVREELQNRLVTACGRLAQDTVQHERVRTFPIGTPAGGEPIDRIGSFFQVPIHVDGATVGLIFVGTVAEDQFEERHLRLLYTVAGQASAAVQRMIAALDAERNRLAAVVRHLPDGVVLLDANRRAILANPPGTLYLATLTDGEVGKVVTRVGESTLDDLATGRQVILTVPGPPPRTLSVSAAWIDHELPECWLLVFRDETEVRTAVRRRDDFLAMLGHELRNPLAAVTTATELLRRPDAKPEIRQRATDILGRQFAHFKRLVSDLLETVRFLNGKIPVVKTRTNLTLIVAEAVQAHSPEFEAEGKRLVAEPVSTPVEVYGDAARLRQVLDNLLINARKYSSPGGRTQLVCRRQGDWEILTVADDGEGIPADRLENIFEPFVQIDDAIDRSRGGLGLGLAMVKSLVEAHGGTVVSASDGPELGSTFTVRLPVLSPAPQPSMDEAATVRSAKRILVVEDEPDVRAMLKSLLNLAGHEVEVAVDGYAAVAAFRQYQPDVSFIDLGLPGLDGFGVAEMVRNDLGRAGTRLIALSGYAQQSDIERSRQAGFDYHLAKPVTLEDLEPLLNGR